MDMCFSLFKIITADGDMSIYFFYSSYLFGMAGGILLLCHFGQMLIDASESLAEGAYFSEWETFEEEHFKKQIIPIMLRAQRAKCLTAMGFADISLLTYTTVS